MVFTSFKTWKQPGTAFAWMFHLMKNGLWCGLSWTSRRGEFIHKERISWCQNMIALILMKSMKGTMIATICVIITITIIFLWQSPCGYIGKRQFKDRRQQVMIKKSFFSSNIWMLQKSDLHAFFITCVARGRPSSSSSKRELTCDINSNRSSLTSASLSLLHNCSGFLLQYQRNWEPDKNPRNFFCHYCFTSMIFFRAQRS